MCVADRQLDAAQTAGDQAAQERQPFGGIDVQAPDFACLSGLTAVASSDADVLCSTVLANLDHQRVDPQLGVGPASNGRDRNACTSASRRSAMSEACLRESFMISRVCTSPSTRRMLTPSR